MSERIYSPKRVLPYVVLCLGLVACSGRNANALPTPTSVPPTPTSAPAPNVQARGYDISWPQCNQQPRLPDSASVAIIGLSGTLANNFNPCFKAQMDQAKRLVISKDNISVYVNTANPGSEPGISDWPKSGETPYGTCDGRDTAACAYEYGRERAAADFQYLQENAPNYTGTVYLDAETDYSWETNVANNQADLEGMVDDFRHHNLRTGVYSTDSQWAQIAGDVPARSSLHDLPVWVAGAGSVNEARNICQGPGFTGGEIDLVQIPGINGQIDADVLCRPTA